MEFPIPFVFDDGTCRIPFVMIVVFHITIIIDGDHVPRYPERHQPVRTFRMATTMDTKPCTKVLSDATLYQRNETLQYDVAVKIVVSVAVAVGVVVVHFIVVDLVVVVVQ